jgi:hypothetical protein
MAEDGTSQIEILAEDGTAFDLLEFERITGDREGRSSPQRLCKAKRRCATKPFRFADVVGSVPMVPEGKDAHLRAYLMAHADAWEVSLPMRPPLSIERLGSRSFP